MINCSKYLYYNYSKRMRIIQITEDEKMNEQSNQDMIKQLRNSFNYVSHEQPSAYKNLPKENSGLQLNHY